MKGQNQQEISFEQMGNLFGDSEEQTTVTQETEEESNLFASEEEESEEQEQEFTLEQEEQQQEVEFTNFAKIVKDFVEDETWEDFKVKHEGVEYESLVDLVSSVEVTEELFKGLIETQTQGRIKKFEDKSIILSDDIDPTKEQLLKAIASGLKNHEPFVETYDNFIEPLKALDLSEQKNALFLIAKYYKDVNGWEDDIIKFKLDQHQANLDVIPTAEQFRNAYITNYEQILIDKQEEQKKLDESLIEQEKESKKTFKESLKQASYDDPFIAKAIPLLYSKDGGQPHWVKEVTKRMEEDPQFKIDFAHWMLNSEDFLNKKLAPKNRETKLKTLDYINVIGAASKKKTPTVDKTEEDSNVLDIVGLNK